MARKQQEISGVFEKNPGTGVWYIRYRVAGKSVRKRIGTRAAAVECLNKVRLINITGQGVVAKSARERTLTQDEIDGSKHHGVTVGQLCADYLSHIQDPANPRRPSDQVNPPQRLRAIGEAFGDRSALSVMPYEVEDWLKSLGKKPGTLNRYRSTFSSVYRYARERAKISINPVRETMQFKVQLPNPRWLQPDEEKTLRSVLDGWIEDCPEHHRLTRLFLRCHPIELTVALGTGMRKGNQYAIRWDEHVDFPGRAFHLPPTMTKTGKPQTIPMIDDVFEALQELRKIQREIAEIQAEGKSSEKAAQRMVADGRVFNISENREWWAAALAEAKIEKFRWHDLRHTFASRLVEAGANMKVVQEACGHASITMTARYAHVSNKTLHDAMSLLNRNKQAVPSAA
jgi:integrase